MTWYSRACVKQRLGSLKPLGSSRPHDEKCPGWSRSGEKSCEAKSRREHCHPDQRVHERQLPDAKSREEQSVDGALGDHDSCIRKECDRHEDGDRLSFTTMKPKCGEGALSEHSDLLRVARNV